MAQLDSATLDLSKGQVLAGPLLGATPGIAPSDHGAASETHTGDLPLTPPLGSMLSGITSGVGELDEWQHDFLTALNDASASKDHEFGMKYSKLVTKAEHAFHQEERWMEEIEFPMLMVCQEQHARVLGALHNVHGRVMDGDFVLGREVVGNLLPQWFAFHVSTIGTALALAMQVAQAGTPPVGNDAGARHNGLPLAS